MASALLFQVSPVSGVPIYRQIIDQVHAHISGRRLKPGDFVPSVRQVAEELRINPMTVSKAYSLLERDGVVELVRGQGMRVVEPSPQAGVRERQGELMPLARQMASAAYRLSLTDEQAMSVLADAFKEIRHGR
jgi:GntR family transcriptional regulator